MKEEAGNGMLSCEGHVKGNGESDIGDGVNLRAWFVGFLIWLCLLTTAACWGLSEIDGHDSAVGWAVWILAGYAFYLSLCCTFFPAPTTWVVMLLASDMVAAQVGIDGYALTRLLVVATVGAVATGLANLNEYHIFTYLLRHRRMAKVRETRLYQKADRWFSASPFTVVAFFGFLPIPVDVIRWLAITARYSRVRFFWAYFVGRWFRYAIWAVAALGLHLSTWHIVGVQVALVAIALGRIVPPLVRRRRESDEVGGACDSSPGDGLAATGP